ncbi:hypothetical protein GJ496_004056 [Pomphorhynchus laevis]|nr:hypothetical protein GJ496_004056 [Pomphorhynchus laevis]
MNDTKIEFEYINNSDGSCRMSRGDCSVICAIMGPESASINAEPVNIAYFNIDGELIDRIDYLDVLKTCVQQAVSEQDECKCTNYQIIIQQLSRQISLDLAINATCLAMLVANVPINWPFAAGLTDQRSIITVIPNGDMIAFLIDSRASKNEEGFSSAELVEEVSIGQKRAMQSLNTIRSVYLEYLNKVFI